MSKVEILAALPKLGVADRREIFDHLCDLEERDLLDRELEEYRHNPETGSPWEEVEARIRKPSRP